MNEELLWPGYTILPLPYQYLPLCMKPDLSL